MKPERAERLARGLVRAARAGARVLPEGARKRLEDRVFYAVFNLTRVTNDAYGWRPPERAREQEE